MKYLLLLILIIPHVTLAQYNEKDVVSFLAGSNEKLWFFERYKVNMGGTDSCDSGQSYTFYIDKKVLIKNCVDKKWESKEVGWLLEKESPYDWWITIEGRRYYLVITKTDSYQLLKLRTMSDAKSKIDEALDMELKHFIDD